MSPAAGDHGRPADPPQCDGGKRPDTARTADRLFAALVPGEAVEFVLGDLAEEAASRVSSGEPLRSVRRWYLRQLLRSAGPLWMDHLRGHARSGTRRRLGTVGSVLGEAARNLRRAPGRGVAVVAIIALGVGANAMMFGVLDRLFLRPPAHIESPDQVTRVFVHLRRMHGPGVATQESHPYPDFTDWRGLDAFASTAAYAAAWLTEGTGAAAERIPVVMATADFFPLLGVEPSLGRFFAAADDRFGSEPVAVLGHEHWREKYGADRAVIGRAIQVGDQSYTIIGVAPPGFTGVDLSRVDVWLPLHPAGMVEEGGTEWRDSRGWYWIRVVARLAPGVTARAAEAAATLAHRTGRAETPDYLEREPRVELASLMLARTGQASGEARVVPWLMGVALMVLLLTCANVANLLLVGALRTGRATAVRRALGASRSRIVGITVAETLILAVVGGAAALLLSAWAGDFFRAAIFPGVGWDGGVESLRVIGFSAALAVFAGLVSGLVPALRASRPEPARMLRSAGRGMTRTRSRLRSGLLVVQAAISVVLLIGTGLFVLSLRAAREVDLGFEPEGALLVRLEPEGGYPGAEAMTGLYREARRVLRSLPGIPVTAITTTVPFRNSRGIGDDLRVPGRDSLPTTGSGGAYINTVTGGYFETSGLAILRGRALTDADDAESAPRVAVVNETMARLVWPDGDALGSCLLIRDAPCATVVGIAENSRRFELQEDESMIYYVPLARAPYPWPPSGLLIRSDSPRAIAPAVQRRLNESLSGLRLVTTVPFRDVIDPTYRSWRLGATLFAVFGLLALIVASLGLYSVLAFEVTERRAEMGLRSALGATPGWIVRFVVGSGVRLAALGVALGVVIGLVAASRAQPLLFGVSWRDPLVLGTVVVTMLVVSVAASGIPAWRVARVDPSETLRAD